MHDVVAKPSFGWLASANARRRAILLVVGPPEPYPKFVNCVNHPALNLETGRMVGELETPTHRGTWEELEAWHGSRVRRVA